MEQNYKNHIRLVPGYHYISALLIYAAVIGSLVNLYKTLDSGTGVYSASLITVLAVALALVHFYTRVFALKAQDRAIRAEENLRHYVLTSKLLDPKLTIRQIIGLRFASDEEYLELCQKAVAENLREKDIKKSIKVWRADTYRV